MSWKLACVGSKGSSKDRSVDIPAHELVDELLLDEKPLESRGIQGVLDPIDQDLDLLVEVSWTPDPSVSLLEVHGPVGHVDMVGGQEPVLDVDPDPELFRRSHDHPDFAVVHLVEKLLPLLVRVEIVDDGDLVCRDSLLDQLLLDVLEEVEGLVAALEGVGEDDLGVPSDFSFSSHRLKTSSTARLTLDPGRSGILGSTRRRSMAAFLARPKRTRGTWLFCLFSFPGSLSQASLPALIHLMKLASSSERLKLKIDGFPALDLRPLHVHVLGKDDVGGAPPQVQELRAVDVSGEPLDHLEIPARRLFGVLDHLPEVGGERVEVLWR